MAAQKTARAGHRRGRRRRGFPVVPLCLAALLLAAALAVARPWRQGEGVRIFVPAPGVLPEWIQDRTIPVNEYSRPGEPMTAVNGIVVHYVGNPGTTAEQNRDYFAGLAHSGETYASSNFLVGLDGEVLLCVPIGEVAYCSNDRNSDTLSIEVCHPDDTGAFTPESYDALIRLVNWLREFYRLDTDAVIRHYDVTGKACPRYFVDHPEAWEQFKQDLLSAGEQP